MIQCTRKELVWETRVNSFGEEEWSNVINYAKQHTNTEYYKVLYNTIKDIAWKDAEAAFWRYINGKQTDSELIIIHKNQYHCYDLPLGEFVYENVLEDNYQSDITDVDYVDDYEQEFRGEEDHDESVGD